MTNREYAPKASLVWCSKASSHMLRSTLCCRGAWCQATNLCAHQRRPQMPLTSNNNNSQPFMNQKGDRIPCHVPACDLRGEHVFGVTSPHRKFRTSDFILQRGNSAKHRGRTGGCVFKENKTWPSPPMERRHFRQDNFAIFRTWERLWSFASFSALLEQMLGACACPQNETLMPDTCTPTASFSLLSCLFSLPLQ